MTLKSNNSYAAGNKSLFTLFSLKSLSRMYGVFFASGFVDNVYWVFTLRQTLHPFIYCFNVQLIYRFRSLGFAQNRKTKNKDCACKTKRHDCNILAKYKSYCIWVIYIKTCNSNTYCKKERHKHNGA